MGRRGLLTDQIATAGHTVLERDALDGDAAILVDHLTNRGVNRMELDLKAQVVGKEGDLFLKDRPQGLRGMDMERSRTPHQSEGGDHAYQSEAMVTVQMGDKDMSQLREADATSAELHLRPFSTVEHQEPVAHLHQLRGGIVTKGGKRTSTP